MLHSSTCIKIVIGVIFIITGYAHGVICFSSHPFWVLCRNKMLLECDPSWPVRVTGLLRTQRTYYSCYDCLQQGCQYVISTAPDSKVHGAHMGSTWGRQDPGGPMWATWTWLSGAALGCHWCQHVRSAKQHKTIEFITSHTHILVDKY